jgi:hypothetical protein
MTRQRIKTQPDRRNLVTSKEAAALMDCDLTAFRKLWMQRDIKHVSVVGGLLFCKSDVLMLKRRLRR